MKILITGTRVHTVEIYKLVEEVLKSFDITGPHILIEGGCMGVDSFAARFAKSLGWHVETIKADWDNRGPQAGPERNQKMVDLKPDICLAIHIEPGLGKGTKDCVSRALKAKIPVRIWIA